MPTSPLSKKAPPKKVHSQRLQPLTSDVASVVFRTPWGWMGLAASPRGLTRVILPRTSRQQASRSRDFETPTQQGRAVGWLNHARREIQLFLRGRLKEFTCPVDLSGSTPFQRAVWRSTGQIPYGRVRSYRWIAGRVGDRRSARAVGNALGANPLPLVIPCHRVVASDASLGGFSGGLQWKRRLLELEGSLGALGAKVKFKVKNSQ